MTRQTSTNFQRLFSEYLAPRKWLLLAGAVFVTISNLCSSLYPRLIGQSVDLIASGQAAWRSLALNLASILSLTIGSGLFMFATRKTIIVASRKIEYELRRDFLAALERQSQRFYDRMPTGVLMAHATNDIAAIREFLGPAIMYSANTLTTFAFVLVFMAKLDVPTTLVALLPLPAIAWTTFRIGKRIYSASKQVQEGYSELTRTVQEAFSGVRILRAFVQERHESSLFANQSKQYIESNLRLARLQALFMPTMMILVGLSQLLVLVFGGYRVLNGTLTIGMLTQFFLYIGQLIWPVAAIGWVSGIIQRSAASLDRFYAIIDHKPELTYPRVSIHQPIRYDIRCQHVFFHYGDGRTILQDITFQIEEGIHVGIVGPVGAGKSTLLRLLARLYDPDQGRITIGNIPLTEFAINDLRTIIRMVPQEPFLFSLSVAENVRVGNPAATEQEIIAALEAAGLLDEVEHFPQQLATIVGERGILLSGGQRQRLAIARALVGKPRILLLDDALSAVDTSTEQRILYHLRQLECTTVIVSHRLSSVEHCDNIIVLENGKITAQGTHTMLRHTNAFYQLLLERQSIEQFYHVPPSTSR